MVKQFQKKHRYLWAIIYSVVLVSFTVFVLLKTFVIEEASVGNVKSGGVYATATSADDNKNNIEDEDKSSDEATSQNAQITDTSYKDSNIDITLTTKRVNETTVYIADIQVSSVEYLKAALAKNTYGRNLKETTSDMAEEHNAILAINGDYYGFRDYGFVLRNGVLYRDTYGDTDDEAFVINEDGNCEIVNESEADANKLLENGAAQILSFGPGLIEDSQISVTENEEVGQARNSNPRTAIGMISPLHYVMVVSDGRTNESAGLTLFQLAQVMEDCGCTQAYNLDGGGSSTLYFNGQIINNPTDGRSGSERQVSDIVYIGY